MIGKPQTSTRLEKKQKQVFFSLYSQSLEIVSKESFEHG
jgi:hypothetical protein